MSIVKQQRNMQTKKGKSSSHPPHLSLPLEASLLHIAKQYCELAVCASGPFYYPYMVTYLT